MNFLESLRDQIGRIFQRRDSVTRTTSNELPPRPLPMALLAERMQADMERPQIIRTCREMYRADPRGAGAIKTLARDMVKGGFEVRCPDNPQAEEVAADLVKRLSLMKRLDDWVRLTLRDGDSFLELSINARQEIVEVTRKPTLYMHRHSDEADQFPDPTRAYWLSEMAMGDYLTEAPADALWFAAWQMLHVRWDHDEDSRYGNPLFGAATGPWKRVAEGELDIAVRRKTRAGMKYVHQFPKGTDETEIEQYKESNQDTFDNPNAPIADFFGAVDIKVVQGDANLSEIEDVKHHIRTWFLASPVPMALLGYGEDLNRDVLGEQSKQYNRALEALTAWVEDEIVKPLLERQWLLAGILPEGLTYEIKWKSRSALLAQDVQAVADAGIKLRALGWSDEAINAVISMFLPGIDVQALMQPHSERELPGRIAAAANRYTPGGRR